MISIKLYKLNANKDHLRRWSQGSEPTNIEVTGTLTDATDFIRPTIIFKDIATTPIKEFNYCFISTFGRWYFIDTYEQINSSTISVTCSVDVAWTFYNDLMNRPGELDRSTNKYSDTLADANTSIFANSKIEEINFPNGLGTAGWTGVLVTTG